jgi:hypothetical protein
MDNVSTRLLEIANERTSGDCDHGVEFDYAAAAGLDAYAVRRRWPRLMGVCPKGCGYSGIAYASAEHYVCGDW